MTDVLRANAHEWARDEAIRVFLKSRPEFVRDAFVRYRIVDPLVFYQSVGTIQGASSR